MPIKIAKFSAHWDPKATRPDLAITNINRFLISSNILLLSEGALFLSRGVDNEHPTSNFQIP